MCHGALIRGMHEPGPYQSHVSADRRGPADDVCRHVERQCRFRTDAVEQYRPCGHNVRCHVIQAACAVSDFFLVHHKLHDDCRNCANDGDGHFHRHGQDGHHQRHGRRQQYSANGKPGRGRQHHQHCRHRARRHHDQDLYDHGNPLRSHQRHPQSDILQRSLVRLCAGAEHPELHFLRHGHGRHRRLCVRRRLRGNPCGHDDQRRWHPVG